MDEASMNHLAMYNQFWMELDNLYSGYAKNRGLSDCAFWILYALCEEQKVYTQKDLCEAWFYSKQTINSALKKLETGGLVLLAPLPGQKKNKQVVLTGEGRSLAQRIISPVAGAEQNAFGRLEGREQEVLLGLTQKYIGFFQAEIEKLIHVSSEDWSSQ